jgi:hypothetical protein
MIGRRLLLKGLAVMTFPGLGGQQPPPQNASPAGQLVPGVQPGVTGQIIARRVIIIGAGGELFVYSPTAAAGNLIASVAGTAGTDSYGNQFLLGIASYAIGFASAVTAGAVVFYSGTFSGGWTEQGVIFTSGTQLFLRSISGGVTLDAPGVTLTSTAPLAIPQSSAGIATVGQLVAALINVGILN